MPLRDTHLCTVSPCDPTNVPQLALHATAGVDYQQGALRLPLPPLPHTSLQRLSEERGFRVSCISGDVHCAGYVGGGIARRV